MGKESKRRKKKERKKKKREEKNNKEREDKRKMKIWFLVNAMNHFVGGQSWLLSVDINSDTNSFVGSPHQYKIFFVK